MNDILGNDVGMTVAQKLKPTDASKFRTYVDDVGHITSLLLSLSGRLAKVENSLLISGSDKATNKVRFLCFFTRILTVLNLQQQIPIQRQPARYYVNEVNDMNSKYVFFVFVTLGDQRLVHLVCSFLHRSVLHHKSSESKKKSYTNARQTDESHKKI